MQLVLESFLIEGTAFETTKPVDMGMAEPLLWRRWASGWDSEVRQVGSWSGFGGRKRMLGEGTNMYDVDADPRDFTGVNPST